MKRIVILLVVLISRLITNGQLCVDGTKWVEMSTNMFDSSYCRTVTYNVNGDTLIDSQIYLKLYCDGKYLLAIRENEKQEVYANYKGVEKMIYDFSWEKGDTLFYRSFLFDDVDILTVIDKVDSVQFKDGVFYKKLNMSSQLYVQGFGDFGGVISNFVFAKPTDGSQTEVSCFYKGNTLIYKNDSFSECECKPNTKIEEVKNIHQNISKIIIAQNEVLFILNGGADKISDIIIYSISGTLVQSVKTTDSDKLSVYGLFAGNYYYTLLNNKQVIATGYFIVK